MSSNSWNLDLNQFKIQLYKSFPDLLFIANKKDLIKHRYYHIKLIENNKYIHTYKSPFFYFSLNHFCVYYYNDLEYLNESVNRIIDWYNKILKMKNKKSEY